MKQYDAIIIGSGQAGTPLSKKLAKAGWKTALIEKRYVGGTCINDGCTPTKTMIASAKMAHMASRKDLGINIDHFSVDMPGIVKRKDEVVHSFRDGSIKGLEETKDLDLIYGTATFNGEKTLTLTLTNGSTEELTAPYIFINTGTATTIPKIEGINTIDYLTSTTILDLQKVPQQLLIIGGSYIGLEFAQMFQRLGSKVTVLENAPKFLSREDDDIATAISDILKDEGITIHTQAQLSSVKKTADGKIEAMVDIAGAVQIIICTHLLIAAGRHPQTADLNLDKTGVRTDEKGYIQVNERLETQVAGIYALGDVKGGPAFTHISYNDHLVVVKNLLRKENVSIQNRMVPYCMFTDPQLGRIGMTEKEARDKGFEIRVAKMTMDKIARGIETGETKGMLKAIVDVHTKQILGASMLAAEGGEMMSMLQLAMMGNITYEQIREGIFAHPTYAESLNNLFMTLDPK